MATKARAITTPRKRIENSTNAFSIRCCSRSALFFLAELNLGLELLGEQRLRSRGHNAVAGVEAGGGEPSILGGAVEGEFAPGELVVGELQIGPGPAGQADDGGARDDH